MLHLVVVSPIRKEKKRKRNINNNLAILPSYDRNTLTSSSSITLQRKLMRTYQVLASQTEYVLGSL